VFWQLLDAETLVFTHFFAQLQQFLHFLKRFFILMNVKNAGIYAFFKKIEDRDVNETL